MSPEYVAGFFDGEGCIHLSKNGQCKIMITQKQPEILYVMQKQFGGGVFAKRNKTGGYFHLQISKKELMLDFLKAVTPYLFVKRAKAEIALQFLELTQSNSCRKQEANGHYLPVDMTERNRLRSVFYNG